MNPKSNYSFVAVDVSKSSLEVKSDEFSKSYVNDADGIADFLDALASLNNPFVVYEATGGYERALQEALFNASVAQHLTSPTRVRAFAKSEGIKAKTDPIDALVLLRFAKEKRPKAHSRRSPHQIELATFMDRRSQLAGLLAQEKTHRENAQTSIVVWIDEMIRHIESQIDEIERAIRELIKKHSKFRQAFKAMMEVCGVGEITAWSILAYLAEITELNRNQVVALVGIAPFNKDSGKTVKPRSIQGGRKKLRKVLYMATQSAARSNPVIKPYVQGLRDRGKPYKCAIVAAMRKLILHLRSILKKEQINLAF